MPDDPIQILEVRADQSPASVTITAAVTADASRAIFIGLITQITATLWKAHTAAAAAGRVPLSRAVQ